VIARAVREEGERDEVSEMELVLKR